jgi:hypothetical protein
MYTPAIQVNRAPVLTLWTAVVAERLGYDWPAALTIGKGLAGINAASKGARLGLMTPPTGDVDGPPRRKSGLGEDTWVRVCGRNVPCKQTEQGLRGCVEDRAVDPKGVEKYLSSRFGGSLDQALAHMRLLAAAYEPESLAEAAYDLYLTFRPEIDPGRAGWGQKGTLDLQLLTSLAERQRSAR